MGNRAAKTRTLILETGTRILRKRLASESGFTLIELLLVVFIIGLASTIVIMSVPGRDSAVEEETVRFERTLDALAARAVLTGDVYALDVSARQYRAMRWAQGDWRTLGDSVHELSGDVSLRVRGEKTEDDFWRLTFDPAGFPLEALIEVSGRGESRHIERVRRPVGAQRR